VEDTWELAAVSIAEANLEPEELQAVGINEAHYLESYYRRQRDRMRLVAASAVFTIGLTLTMLAADENISESLWNYFIIEKQLSYFRLLGAFFLFVGTVFSFFAVYKNTLSAASSNSELVADAAKKDIPKQSRDLSSDEKELIVLRESEYRMRREENRQRDLAIRQTRSLRLKDHSITEDWKEYLLSSRLRLIDNAERLGQRSRTNLVWGVMLSAITIMIVSFLIYLGRNNDPSSTWVELISENFSKLTLVLVLQFLAFFFLKNFIKTEQTIERNKHEITDIELKMASVFVAASYGVTHNHIVNAFVSGKIIEDPLAGKSADKNQEKLLSELLKLTSKHLKIPK